MTKRILLITAFFIVGTCMPAVAERVYYTYDPLHLKFVLDTETKEAMLGNGIDQNYQSSLDLFDDNLQEWPDLDFSNLVIPSTITCEGWGKIVGSLNPIQIESATYTVTSIADYALYACLKTKTITLPETIKEIGDYAFYGNIYLRSINIPETVTIIKEGTFHYCRSVEKLVLPNGIKSIGYKAFSDCENLKEINIPGNCLQIGNDAFTWCPKLSKVTIEDGPGTLNVGYAYNIGLRDKRIDPEPYQRALFADCHIDTLYLGRNISYPHTNKNVPLPPFEHYLIYSSWGDYYYNRQSSYKRVEFGETVTEIADSLFAGVIINGGINFSKTNSLKRIGKDAFYHKISVYTSYSRCLEIPASVEYIGENAFRNNYLSEVVFHDGLQTISKNAFSENRLSNVSIPGTVTNIQDYAFYNNKIVNLELTDGIQEIGTQAFGNNEIKTLDVPASVTLIGSGFSSSLLNVYCNPLTPPNTSNPFADATIYVPTGKGTIYRNQWGASTKIIDSEDDVLTINVKTAGTLYSRILARDVQLDDIYRLKLKGTLNDDDYSTISNMSKLYELDMSGLNMEGLPNGYFSNNTQLIKIVLPTTLQMIEDNAFEGCLRLNGTITIPENCTSIGSRAFYGLNFSKLVCNEVVNIHEEAFMNCSCLKEVQLPQGTVVGTNAFSSTAIEELYIPANVIIGDRAFKTTTLNKVTFDGGGQEIGNNVFENTVERYTFNGSIKTIGIFAPQINEVFVDNIYTWCSLPFTHPVKTNKLYINNEEANSVVIPEDIKSLRNYIFYGCSTIQSIELPGDIIEIPDRAFKECANLSTIIFSANLEVIGDSAFAKCVNLSEITLPSKVKTIGSYSFAGCELLETINLSPAMTSIGDGAFMDCSLLDNVILPQNLLSIGSSAFNRCSTLKEIDFPVSITSIGEYALSNCESLTLVVAHWKEPISVTNLSGDCLLYVPIGTSQKYVNAGWDFSNMKERGVLTIRVSNGGEVICYGVSVSDNSTQLFFLPYTDIPITINPDEGYNIVKAIMNGQDVLADIENGNLSIEEAEEDINLYIVFGTENFLWGDANGDHVLNNDDVITIANKLIKNNPLEFYKYAADMNDDGVINITDVILLISKINKEK